MQLTGAQTDRWQWLILLKLTVKLRPIFVTRASPKPPVGRHQILELEDYKGVVGDLTQSANFCLSGNVSELQVKNEKRSVSDGLFRALR